MPESWHFPSLPKHWFHPISWLRFSSPSCGIFPPYDASMVKWLIVEFSYKSRLPQSGGVQSCVKIESESLWMWISREAAGFYLHFLFPGRDVSWCFLYFSSGGKQQCKMWTKRHRNLLAAALCWSPVLQVFSCSVLYLRTLGCTCQWALFRIR